LFRKFLLLSTLTVSSAVFACPDDQYEACIVPRPFGGCAQHACLPKIHDPAKAMIDAINDKAFELAISARDNEKVQDRNDCIIIVTAGLATWGAVLGGPWGALIGGGAGGAAASLACRRAFPLED